MTGAREEYLYGNSLNWGLLTAASRRKMMRFCLIAKELLGVGKKCCVFCLQEAQEVGCTFIPTSTSMHFLYQKVKPLLPGQHAVGRRAGGRRAGGRHLGPWASSL